MNILFVCSAKSWGGNEKWSTMAMSVLAENHKMFFFGRKKPLGDRFGKTIPKSFAPMFAYWDLYSFIKAWHFLKKNKISCIVSTKKKEYFIFGILSRILGIKHYIRLGIVRDMNRPIWHNLVYNKLNDGIIANAHKIEDNLRTYRFMQKKPVFVLYNAIPGLKDLASRPRILSDKFQIVSTGMLTKRKGFHLLVESIAQLDEKLKHKLSVSFIGSGREENSLRKSISDHKLENIIHMEGFQNNPLNFLEKANLFVLLSSNEGISNALIEAMACGIPALTTDSGGSTEFITQEHNGFIVERQISAIVDALKNILNTTPAKLEDLGSAGQSTVLNLFNELKFKEEIFKIFS